MNRNSSPKGVPSDSNSGSGVSFTKGRDSGVDFVFDRFPGVIEAFVDLGREWRRKRSFK